MSRMGLRRQERGQVVVEYVILLALVLGLLGVLSQGFRGSLFKLWRVMTQEVQAPCPGCSPE